MADTSTERKANATLLALRGQPLHTRTLVLEALREDAKRIRAVGEIIDLRKCDFVPLGGDLQTAGFIHQMKIVLWIDRQSRVIERLETEQPHVAYEANETTQGESCRDPAPQLQSLVGLAVDGSFHKQLSGVFGGALGCSHLLTLAQMMGNGLSEGLTREDERGCFDERRDSERIFKRHVALDGSADGEDRFEVAIQQTDFDMKPQGSTHSLLDRLARQHDVRVHGRVDFGNMSFASLDAAARTREGAGAGFSDWHSVGDALEPLVGGSALGGLSARLFALLGQKPEAAPVLDALLQLGPGLMQCLAATSGRWLAHTDASPAPGGTSAASTPNPGSRFSPNCYMWREGGKLR